MALNERDKMILQHIIDYCDDIKDSVARFGASYEAFCEDKAYRHACAMCILQIGELAGKLTPEFRTEHSSIPWTEIRAMRNVAAHSYGDISVTTTWETIEDDIPALRAFCVERLDEK